MTKVLLNSVPLPNQVELLKPDRISRLLFGGNGSPFMKVSVESVNAALPNSRVAAMPGQKHFADQNAPELFLQNAGIPDHSVSMV